MSTLAGVGRLTRFVARRDRLRLLLWVAAVAGLVLASAASLPPVYPDQQAVEDYVRLFGDNPALVAFGGPGYGFDDPNLGVVLVNETQVFGCIGIALMSTFLVNRHTRAEEDSERAELVRSAAVGRHAPTAAAVATIAAVNVAIGALCAVGFVALGYATAGSIALAGSLTAVGLMFTGITAVAAQVMGASRSTLGLATAALAVAFVLRAVGDVGDNAVRWLSPIGWAQGVRAFADERWWLLGVCLVAAVAATALAFWLSTRRDLGSGLVPQRPGPPVAGSWSRHPTGLAVVLQRGALAAWMVALFGLGVLYGSIGDDVEQLVEDNPEFADLLAQIEGVDLTDSFFGSAMTMLAVIGAGFAISSALRLRAEERAGRVEAILAGPTSRGAWASGHLLVALAGSVLVMAAAGLGTGVAYAAVSGDGGAVGRLVVAALVTVPAVWVLAGIAVALFGLSPAASPAAWAALAFVAVIGFLAEVLRLPQWTRSLSPLAHVPAVPAEDLRVLPLVVLTVVAAGLVAGGLWGWRARDLRAG